MNMPEFTAQASLYTTSNRYRSSGSEVSGLPSTQSVVAAYHPGPTTQAICNGCLQVCSDNWRSCENAAIALFWWDPFVLLTALRAKCDSTEERCRNGCADVCCPQLCGPGEPSTSGAGCCDADESCVDQNDPNSRNGCCPSNQTVCGSKCCPAGFSCIGGLCTTGFPNTPPPPLDDGCMLFGGVQCGKKCCYGGLKCCGVFNGQPVCKTDCIA